MSERVGSMAKKWSMPKGWGKMVYRCVVADLFGLPNVASDALRQTILTASINYEQR